MSVPAYAELHCYSPFSFHRGASSVSTLLERARDLGLTALAITDRDGLYASVRQWMHSRSMVRDADHSKGLPPATIYGADLCLDDASRVVALVRDAEGWSNLCALLSLGQGACEKGSSVVSLQQLAEFSGGLTVLSGGRFGPVDRALLGLDSTMEATRWMPKGPWGRPLGLRDGVSSRDLDGHGSSSSIAASCRDARARASLLTRLRREPEKRINSAMAVAARFRDALGDRFLLELQDHCLPEDQWLRAMHRHIGAQLAVPCVATNLVHYAEPKDRCLQDVVTCIRLGRTLREAETGLLPNAHFHLKSPVQMARLFVDNPAAVERTVDVAAECRFELSAIPYSFPLYPVPSGHSLQSFLEDCTSRGAVRRYGSRLDSDSRIRDQLRHELQVIGRMGLAGYFLVVWDLVQECSRRGILCQGRGSAANSCVCYCLGITAVDPIHLNLLFARFLSEERGGFPDIDVDISNSRREEVLQFVYEKYGRDQAAMVSNVITYHPRSALRDVGKVFGLSREQISSMSSELHNKKDTSALQSLYRAPLGTDAASGEAMMSQVFEYSDLLCGMPRHMGVHSGGVVISGKPLTRVCPIENAAMVDRTVLQWDKDDVAHTGLVKIDLLALGMLSAIEEASSLLAERSIVFDMARLSYDDARVYDLICAADTVGLFQIESRAQMNTLPRLRPRCFHDLVVEIALIRPGPIQGEMVHPYLRRRQGREPVSYAHPSLEPILERTLGIPLFQEQAMKMAVATAGFSPAQADRLRKVMGFKRASKELGDLFAEMLVGMKRNGLDDDVALRVCDQLRGFAAYGFPESHAASFALIVYASAWLKKYQAPSFFAALLNCQPMGFYSPATLVADARRHGVLIEPVSVALSAWRWMLDGERGIRAGFMQLRGLSERDGQRIVAERERGMFRSVASFCDRCSLARDKLEVLADSGALDCLGVDRRTALWQVSGWRRRLPLEGPIQQELLPGLQPMGRLEKNLLDHHLSGFSPEEHPLALVRPQLRARGIVSSASLQARCDGEEVCVAGFVITRQRPNTAKGTFFMTLEDELGFVNLIVHRSLFDQNERLLRQVSFMTCSGRLQRCDGVTNVLATAFEDLSGRGLLDDTDSDRQRARQVVSSRDFH
jgi:error-prone DNA polymerase